jgi:hypothetical protein
MARIYDKKPPYPSQALRDAVVATANVWSDSNELTSVLTTDVLNESLRGVQPFKSENWWYWFSYGDSVNSGPRPLVWLRSFTKPQIAGNLPSNVVTTDVLNSEMLNFIKGYIASNPPELLAWLQLNGGTSPATTTSTYATATYGSTY